MNSRPTLSPLPVQRWSTDSVAPARRLDLYAEALTCAVDPMHVTSRRRSTFDAEVRSGGGSVCSVVQARGSAHRCVRDEHEIAASGERCFHLIINTSSSWRLTHRGEVTLRPGDAVLLDSTLPHAIELPDFSITHLRMSASWLKQWLGAPDVLVGRVLPNDASWSRALTTFAAQLTPELLAAPPLPGRMLFDHVGVTLALVAEEWVRPTRRVARIDRSLVERVRSVIAERSAEPGLGASDVAGDAGISTRTLHRCLAAHGASFARLLIDSRLQQAMRMLSLPSFDRVSAGEIGRRAGFADASHFGRVMRIATGMTPSAFRRSRGRPAGSSDGD